MSKRILITVGGTGGHIYPAMSVARELKKRMPDAYIMFAGHGLSENSHFDKQTFPYADISSGPFPASNPLTCLKSVGKVLKGLFDSGRLIMEFKPDLVIGFGSYHTFPTLLASRFCKAPIILHEANTIPGKVNRLLARHSIAVATQFPDTASLLQGKTVEVGMPEREGYRKGVVAREEACRYFNLKTGWKTLLVFGGSQGAFALNDLMVEWAVNHPQSKQPVQVVHFTGSEKHTARLQAAYSAAGIPACVRDYEQRMDCAWEIADLVIGRSGAGTMAEALQFEVPSILVPYPHAADDHQVRNALFMQNIVGGAIMLPQGLANGIRLQEELDRLFANGDDRLGQLKARLVEYKNNQTKRDFCSLIQELLPQ